MEKMSSAERVAQVLIQSLEKGVCPWHCGWNKGYGSPCGIGNRPYRGINWVLTNSLPYANRKYLTYKKCAELGGHIKKGEKGNIVTLWQPTNKEDKETGKTKRGLFLKYYTVFNVEQTEGLPKDFYDVKMIDHKPLEEGESIIDAYRKNENSPRDWEFGGNEAFYDMISDFIRLPKMGQFKTIEEYYSTAFHEMAHSTGRTGRLSRWDLPKDATKEEVFEDRKQRRFGGIKYAQEELVAELSSAILMSEIGITTTLENSASYCANWAKALGGMTAHEIVKACGQAQKAVDFIRGIKTQVTTED